VRPGQHPSKLFVQASHLASQLNCGSSIQKTSCPQFIHSSSVVPHQVMQSFIFCEQQKLPEDTGIAVGGEGLTGEGADIGADVDVG